MQDRNALDEVLVVARQSPCPHCRRTGTLVGHGLVMGYAERGTDRDVRGRRLLCSARARRTGCGRTCSVLIATVIAGFTVGAATLSRLLEEVVSGRSRKRAWERLQEAAGGGAGLSLRSCYRLWSRLCAAQSRIRTALSGFVPPPATADAHPVAQMLAHLRLVAGTSGCVVAAYQLALQRGVFA